MNQDNKHIFSILGGDRRQAVLAKELLAKGHEVRVFGLGTYADECIGVDYCSKLEKAIKDSEIILLPLPVTRDNVKLNSSEEEITELTKIVDIASREKNVLIFGGMIPESFLQLCKKKGVEIYDYYKSEFLQIMNALPSAEGALMLAMEQSDITVKGMRALVCGYGRIGKLLSSILYRLGAEVTVLARNPLSLCEASLNGYNTVQITGDAEVLRCSIQNSDVIFNTVPFIIFNKTSLTGLTDKPIYIEIASSPGGIDISSARDAGIRIVYAPSLPGRYSPVSAGEYIFETLKKILNDRGILI